MTTDPIILIPPTHEQSVYGFHVEERLLTRFLEFLEQKGLSPWRPPVPLDKNDANEQPLIQVDVESKATQAMMEDLKTEFLSQE
ncbi:hypothetical protein SAMN02745166_03281 [Prosthecobacter debontii]|uniref:Uncharacterized protein n=1 Tax=Prosthecobacter debontii TaxID=48467 RepID=A0A1T4YH62_9BACT|nr:hypothetical protein [Prosthecobacter debontii]SKB01000.1 hypothetical protein SAMN02745166_03281 [Prosthecobacter debontii]